MTDPTYIKGKLYTKNYIKTKEILEEFGFCYIFNFDFFKVAGNEGWLIFDAVTNSFHPDFVEQLKEFNEGIMICRKESMIDHYKVIFENKKMSFSMHRNDKYFDNVYDCKNRKFCEICFFNYHFIYCKFFDKHLV